MNLEKEWRNVEWREWLMGTEVQWEKKNNFNTLQLDYYDP